MTGLNNKYIEKYKIKMKFKHTNSSPSIRRTTDINYGEIKKTPITWTKCQLLYILTFCEIQYLNVFP